MTCKLAKIHQEITDDIFSFVSSFYDTRYSNSYVREMTGVIKPMVYKSTAIMSVIIASYFLSLFWSQQIAWAIYDTQWIYQSAKLNRNIRTMILRSQDPRVVSQFILPSPSLEYYVNVVKMMLSYLMTVRTIISRSEEKKGGEMMANRMTIQRAFQILRVCGDFTTTWPPKAGAGNREVFFRDVYWTISIFLIIEWMVFLCTAVYHYHSDVILLTKSFSELVAAVEVVLDIIVCRIKRDRLQFLMTELEDFVSTCKENELAILQKYVNRYLPFYAYVSFGYFITGFVFVFGPLFLNEEYPTQVWYPFSTRQYYRKFLLYITQVFSILQVVTCITVDFTTGMIIFFTTARLEITCQKLKCVTSYAELKECFILHQTIIRYLDVLRDARRFLLMKTNVTMALTTITGGVPLLWKQPLAVATQFVCMVVCGIQRLYAVTWPANDLKEMSQQITQAAYDAPWIYKSAEMSSDVKIMMMRGQDPLIIPLGIFPALTLEYFANFLKTAFSYFMAMKATIKD
ncbi:hypothetical protein KM043_018406 [Ampulex compressa]|nr:hypothetical protein KM043_018406 [Ampulex compressa]